VATGDHRPEPVGVEPVSRPPYDEPEPHRLRDTTARLPDSPASGRPEVGILTVEPSVPAEAQSPRADPAPGRHPVMGPDLPTSEALAPPVTVRRAELDPSDGGVPSRHSDAVRAPTVVIQQVVERRGSEPGPTVSASWATSPPRAKALERSGDGPARRAAPDPPFVDRTELAPRPPTQMAPLRSPGVPVVSRRDAAAEPCAEERTESVPTPTIHVSIGRVEVRAVQPAPPLTRTHRSARAMSLDEYLAERNGRSRS
jgi:hypothetical protein